MTEPIPQPPGVPLLGNIFDVDSNNTWASLNKLARKYGPIFKIKALGHQIVFVANVNLLQEICDERRFRKCVTGPIVEIRHAVHDSLFTAYDHEASWGIAHRIMAPMLTPPAVAALFDDMRGAIADLTAKWSAAARQRVHVTNDLDRLNLESCLRCFFDQRQDALDGPEPPMIKAMDGATWEAMKRPTRPRFLNWLVYQRRFNRDTRTMRAFAAQLIAHRESHPSEKKDMLRALLEASDPQTGSSLTRDQVIDEIISIFIGAATAPNLVSFALYYLATNPTELAKARAELDAIPDPLPLSQSHRASLPYCEAILRESLRLSAAAPGFNIEPLPSSSSSSSSQGPESDPILLAGGRYAIPRSQPIIAVLGAVNRDPEYFADPEAFRPERMLGERYEQLPTACKKGFGNGKRECIGKVYAWEWSFATLVSIIKEVDFELADPAYRLHVDDINGAFSVKPVNFFAVTGPRRGN